jgi:urea transport system ATP-binding protein
MLSIQRLTVGYGRSLILHDVSLDVAAGQVVCLMGRNGVGKSTLLKSIIGLLRPRAGSIELESADLTALAPYRRARAGIGYVPQGRGLFPQLTVRENLLMGLEAAPGRVAGAVLDEVHELFPVLATMAGRVAGTLSGGQQQQLAIARALMGRPKVLLLDEPTEGIQPSIIWEIERAVETLRAQRQLSILLVEQFVEFAMGLADYFYLMEKGTIVSRGSARELTEDKVRAYLAV